MRAIMVGLVFAIGLGVAFELGRRMPGAAPAATGDSASVAAAVVDEPEAEALRRRTALRRIAGSDTYLTRTVRAADSVLVRWVGREDRPLRVYFEPTALGGYRAAMGDAVRDALGRWARVEGLPVVFEIVQDPALEVEVTVRWIRSFPLRRAGQTDLVWGSDGSIRRGTLTLATHSRRGRPLSPDAIFTVALHEVGHLLGLGHSDRPDDVMYPSTSVDDLTDRDENSARLLYELRPGPLRSLDR